MVVTARAPCDEQVIASKEPTRAVPCPENVGRAVLIATILASSMVFIDSSAVNVALPVLQREFGATAAQAQWVVESYALLLAALILVGGVFGDRFGRKRLFLIGTVLFTITSVLCGLAQSIEMLIAARAAQGVAGALLTPASLAIISAAFGDKTERGRAIGTWSGFTAITSAFGPVLGGWLVENISWRWVFFINLPLAAIVVLVALRGVPESRDEEAGQLDILGAVLATIGLGTLVFGLIEGPARGWGDPIVVGSLVVGVLGLIAFVVAEMRVPSPMLPLDLFRAPTFAGANLLTLLLYGAFGGALFWMPFNLIQVQGYPPTAAGAALLPAILILFALSRWTGALIGRYGAKLPLTIGPGIVALALLLFARPGTDGSYWTTFFPAAVVLGIGMAITVPPLTTAIMSAVPQHLAGTASGINNAVARTAGLIAIAIFGVLVSTVFARQLTSELDAIPDLPPAVREAVEAQRADLAAAQPPLDTDPEIAAAVNDAIDSAFVAGFRAAMLVGAGMALAGALIAWRVVEGKPTSAPSASLAA
ncbi:MAG: DHA2 family efflux MFS transporter permease subunit [Chloroflexia bacterium]|nr:DHA2 family efflux MFS transporter permease subunit [Chloroflexia bacterium]